MQLATMVHDSEGVLDADHRYVMAARVDMAVLASRLEASEIVIEQVDLITAAVSRAQTAVDVLSEYGFVEAPAAKLDEVAEYLAARGDLSRSATVRALRVRLIGS
jgi:hypothetical protein